MTIKDRLIELRNSACLVCDRKSCKNCSVNKNFREIKKELLKLENNKAEDTNPDFLDKTYCSRKCGNKKCFRHKDLTVGIFSVADFCGTVECKGFIEVD